ncbi:MAG: phosphoribosyltransferase [Proteobacteria bacterium]|nr:phosphoribosyltransferase [Pseudomonadota bacterium]
MSFWLPFKNREAAGRALASALSKRKFENPIVLAMPRGGVPVAIEIAQKLKAPLDFVFVRRIGVPGHKEVAMAAVVDGAAPELVLNEEIRSQIEIPQAYIDREMKAELHEIERRRRDYAGTAVGPEITGRTAIIVDDGIATGTSMRAAINALRRKKPKELVVAVPVAPQDTIDALRSDVDAVVCLQTPEPFYAVGMHYKDFHQIDDAEIAKALHEFRDSADLTQNAT